MQVSGGNMSSDSMVNINCRITEYDKRVPIQEIVQILKSNTVLEKCNIPNLRYRIFIFLKYLF